MELALEDPFASVVEGFIDESGKEMQSPGGLISNVYWNEARRSIFDFKEHLD